MSKVKGTSRTTSSIPTSSVARIPSSQGATSTFSTSATSESQSVQQVAQSFPVLGTESLFLNEHSRAPYEQQLAKGNLLLDQLEVLRVGLIAGGIPKEDLVILKKTLSNNQGFISKDPKLLDMMLEIETRVRVEIAKYGTESSKG